MVLGLRTKNRKSPTVQVDYLIHLQEIKPWPPSQSLRSLRSTLIQWEHGDRNSGSTNPVIPSLGSGSGSGVGDGKIEFNESFRLPVTLLREISIKGGDGDTFQKNCLEFNLYEPRRDKTVKGQLLGTAIVDLADYGIVKEALSISAPMSCKRSFRNISPPVLFLKIQPVEKSRTSSLRRDGLLREASMDRNAGESVSALMNEEYAEEAEVASFTDDDVSSHSSIAISSSTLESNGGSPPQKEENGSNAMKDSPGGAKDHDVLASKQRLAEYDIKPEMEPHGSLKGSSRCSSSTDLSSDLENPENVHTTSSDFRDPSLTLIPDKIGSRSVQSSSITCEGTDEELNTNTRSNGHDNLAHNIQQKVPNGGSEIRFNAIKSSKESMSTGPLAEIASSNMDPQVDDKLGFPKSIESQVHEVDDEKGWTPSMKGMHEPASAGVSENGSAENKDQKKHQESGQEGQFLEKRRHYIEDERLDSLSQDDTRKKISLGNDALSVSRENQNGNILNIDRLKHVKSVRSPMDSGRSNGSSRTNQFVEKMKDDGVPKDAKNGARSSISSERKDAKAYLKETRINFSESKMQQLEHRIKMLEGELREAAAIEVSLYSVVAEHGSSINKVHAPARRLSRLYLHACKENSQSMRASVARSAVSGLVLVAKACGNDVPRLTFWLSNSVVLRAIISQAFEEQQLPFSAGPFVERASVGKGNKEKSSLSLLKWKESSSRKETRSALRESFDDWEDPRTFTSALEKIEAWIFCRVVESVWWQTLTPYMQSTAAKAISVMGPASSKIYQRTSSSGDQEQGNFSLELWKKAFRDTCERICPVRAGGHECGCLPVLSRLVMEQCVGRLDVAMFNAILRESADEIPTDPVSDPISDANVLPITAGKASFGAGAQLKNAIGNWSRWLTDIFGIDDDYLLEAGHKPDDDSEREEYDSSFKSFHLLNALSDLMMLPKDMLLSRSIRKEVCPTFGASLIKKILDTFVPDEFCPDPIPDIVLEALESEDPFETREDSVVDFPCSAAPIVYLPPSVASLANILGDCGSQSRLRLTRSGSLVLRKSYTSDDELDELDSPITSIIDTPRAPPAPSKPSWTSKENSRRNAVRYQLLREVWMDSE